MKRPDMRKALAATTVITLALGASLTYGLMRGLSVNAKSAHSTYANGSTVSRPCNITVNGVVVDSFNFPPTGSWSNYSTTLRSINLGTATGFRNVRITATTAAGGPNIDRMRFGIL
jgi:hypothetical protein